MNSNIFNLLIKLVKTTAIESSCDRAAAAAVTDAMTVTKYTANGNMLSMRASQALRAISDAVCCEC